MKLKTKFDSKIQQTVKVTKMSLTKQESENQDDQTAKNSFFFAIACK